MVEARQNRFGFGYSLCSETTAVVEDGEEQQRSNQEYLQNSYASGNPLSKRAKKIFNLLSFKRKKILELSFSKLEIPKQNFLLSFLHTHQGLKWDGVRPNS